MKYNRLEEVNFQKSTKSGQIWVYRCDCGNLTEKRRSLVVAGKTKSCGCLYRERHNDLFRTKFYWTYQQIKQRCNNKNNPRYKYYGGRGILCLWDNFSSFQKDMYKEFLDHNSQHGGRNTSIDRIDNNGNYCKANCRWATQSEQNLTRRKK